MTGHTPGPWTAGMLSKTGGWDIWGGRGIGGGACVIASRSSWVHRGEESIANAHLIAAAPELLDALKRIEELAGDMSVPSTGRCGDIGRVARAAIAKAEGRA